MMIMKSLLKWRADLLPNLQDFYEEDIKDMF